MKLLSRSTYYYLIFSIPALIAAGVGFYFAIRSIVYNQIDDSLITEKTIIQDQIEETDTIPDFTASFGHQIEIRLVESGLRYSQVIHDTDIYDSKSGTTIPFRHIRFTGSTRKHTGYIINIYNILNENRNLLDRIAIGMLFLLIILLISSLVVNYLVSKKLWRPFYISMNEVSDFNVQEDKPLKLPETNIDEFRQLNSVLRDMTRKIRRDYINLKEYNENSSHEIQTPLAVIQSKLDMLMQSRRLSRENLKLIRSINEAAAKIFKLNQGLLLISKIENMQFPETREISLRRLVEKALENYEEIMHLKGIRVDTEFTEMGIVNMNKDLAEVLISNLLGNAIRYNIDGGLIICRLDNESLTITNSGLPLKVDAEKVFNRFQKGTDNPEAVGLGLSIVKKITDFYRMKISFSSNGTTHEIKLIYRNEPSS